MIFGSSKGFDNIDLHGIRHKEAMEMVISRLEKFNKEKNDISN